MTDKTNEKYLKLLETNPLFGDDGYSLLRWFVNNNHSEELTWLYSMGLMETWDILKNE